MGRNASDWSKLAGAVGEVLEYNRHGRHREAKDQVQSLCHFVEDKGSSRTSVGWLGNLALPVSIIAPMVPVDVTLGSDMDKLWGWTPAVMLHLSPDFTGFSVPSNGNTCQEC
jgi:hypothetical protein